MTDRGPRVRGYARNNDTSICWRLHDELCDRRPSLRWLHIFRNLERLLMDNIWEKLR